MSDAQIAPIIDSDVKNDMLLASHNPREALNRIGYLVQDAKEHIRNGDKSKAFDCLNRIGWLTGAL